MSNNWTIPGTTLQIDKSNAPRVGELFQSMFLSGGMVLSQVANITGLEAYTVQNWVKRGFLAPPNHKQYTMEQLCRIININMLKSILPMERICGLLSYINGDLDDDRDDIIKDCDLYFIFVKLAARARQLDDAAHRDEIINETLADNKEPVPGAKERIKNALCVMLTAWVAARMKQEAEAMLEGL